MQLTVPREKSWTGHASSGGVSFGLGCERASSLACPQRRSSFPSPDSHVGQATEAASRAPNRATKTVTRAGSRPDGTSATRGVLCLHSNNQKNLQSEDGRLLTSESRGDGTTSARAPPWPARAGDGRKRGLAGGCPAWGRT